MKIDENRYSTGETLTLNGLMKTIKYLKSKKLKKYQAENNKAMTDYFNEQRQKLDKILGGES